MQEKGPRALGFLSKGSGSSLPHLWTCQAGAWKLWELPDSSNCLEILVRLVLHVDGWRKFKWTLIKLSWIQRCSGTQYQVLKVLALSWLAKVTVSDEAVSARLEIKSHGIFSGEPSWAIPYSRLSLSLGWETKFIGKSLCLHMRVSQFTTSSLKRFYRRVDAKSVCFWFFRFIDIFIRIYWLAIIFFNFAIFKIFGDITF